MLRLFVFGLALYFLYFYVGQRLPLVYSCRLWVCLFDSSGFNEVCCLPIGKKKQLNRKYTGLFEPKFQNVASIVLWLNSGV